MRSNPLPRASQRDLGPAAALDIAVVKVLRDWFGPEHTDQMAALVLTYRREADAMIGALERDAGRDDRAAMAQTLHKLRGASATIGATTVARLCATVNTVTSLDLLAIASDVASEQRRFATEIGLLLAAGTEANG
ncbi:MAG: hypothetical protein QOF30_1135 [Acidimicrobiaceae bacterium]|nr:hypothetical protein [Acidimicrobiaceae bacterium]